ncbi:hypothetical protein BDA99DRAFT_558055 [Phascolomyces articulosus]|uniref:Uncharacterized protein n=1 Tax=Phascolomyces articulosus TaxID=60185 RepID=A0AAD5K552_9FUNG|nr:hypothetical protein BDA99DRAFT_558055 [Phascolomyces articulosus]
MSSRKHHRRDSDDDYKRKHKKSKHNNVLSDELKESIQSISSDDYFEKATEFRLWLKEEKDRYFGDLDSDDARHYFKKFVKAWNRHDLEEKYYKGMNSTQLSSSDTTGYRWSFAKKLDQHEQDRIRDNVDSLTNAAGSNKGKRRNVGPAFPAPPSSSSSQRRFDRADFEEKQERERSGRRAERKAEAKRSRSRREEYLDEVAPKETGREAQIAKRRATNAYHKRERETDVELTEADIYGGGDDFKARLAAEKRKDEARQQRRQQRQDEKMGPMQERLAQHKAKEDATMEMFRKMAEEQKKRGGL